MGIQNKNIGVRLITKKEYKCQTDKNTKVLPLKVWSMN